MKVVPVDVGLLWLMLHNQQALGVPYLLGGKAPSLDCDMIQTQGGIDCSGEFRLFIARGTNGQWIVPDGSATQHEYFEQLAQAGLLRKVNYADVIKPPVSQDDARLFVAFMNPNPIGHVWMVNAGHTIESFGHNGPGSRDASAPMFRRIVSACYELPVAA